MLFHEPMAYELADRLQEFRGKWLRETTTVQPSARERAAAALSGLYGEHDFRRLPELIWRVSPDAAADSLGGPQGRRSPDKWLVAGRHPGANLSRAFERELRRLDQWLSASVHSQIHGQVTRALRFADRHPTPLLLRELHSAMAMHGELDLATDELGTSRGSPEFEAGFCTRYLDWLAAYAFCRDVLGVPCPSAESRRLDLWLELARCCSGFWPYEQLVAIADTPSVASFDEQDRLHHASGPALAYADRRLCYWRGTSVPETWISDPTSVDAHHVLRWPDVEQRRAAVEIFGWAWLLQRLEPHFIDTDPDPSVGQLFEVRLPQTSAPARFLRVRCGTGREFVLAVPPTVLSARAANA